MIILSIDPGTIHLGITIFKLDKDLNIENLKTIELLLKEDNKNITMPNLSYRVHKFSKEFRELLKEYHPNTVAFETPFINFRRPASVIPLAMIMGLITTIALDYDPYIYIHKISPSEVKNAIGAKGNSDKDGVLKAIKKNKEISKHINLDNISDHEVDSIAVGYGFLKIFRKTPSIFITG